ncbi:hypothetical protein SGFS_000610 [Streptomyces graminofaciens]|uniref:Uncharacterized protein n=1 Tax=Streptomyces graminofaciens TaxID=68212 RepID=A0ABN5V760_9ACTN|nr:hypothetical protein SGFS_000610 [Streptomyces graminofaciens]
MRICRRHGRVRRRPTRAADSPDRLTQSFPPPPGRAGGTRRARARGPRSATRCGQPARTTTRKKEKPMEAKSQAAARTSTTQTPENLATEEVVIAVDVDDEE